jgi:Tfp pilus assembly pilus retraction ATPase PilT
MSLKIMFLYIDEDIASDLHLHRLTQPKIYKQHHINVFKKYERVHHKSVNLTFQILHNGLREKTSMCNLTT